MKFLEGYCVYPDTEIPPLLENDRISKLLTGSFWMSDRSDPWCSNIVPGLIRMIIPWGVVCLNFRQKKGWTLPKFFEKGVDFA